ncbi:MAG: copper chaperone [Bacteroidetes bacterium]|nr:MAG: copper chaperone [Bacteroidota bacterium]
MIFFFFSFLASLFGGIQASRYNHYSFGIQLSVDNPFAGIIAFWPFIVALVLLLLAILWYQAIKGMQRRKSQAGTRQKSGTQNTVFLGIVTVFVLILLAAPWYLGTFEDKQAAETEIISAEDRVEMVLTVHGMDCGGCESLVNRRVGSLEGVESVSSSHMREEVVVVYNQKKVTLGLITQTIEDSGYTVILN